LSPLERDAIVGRVRKSGSRTRRKPGISRIIEVAVAATALLSQIAVSGIAVSAQKLAPGSQVVVRSYNMAGVPPRQLSSALETARAILGGAAIDLVWHECGPCDEAPGPRELIVRMVEAPPQAEPESLGYSLIDVKQQTGSLATIFASRVESLAASARFDPGVLLGRTIAHELAHLLIGTTEHSTHGLMRSHWAAPELERDRRRDWVLSREEGARMRQGLIAREAAALTVATSARP
jgi:hypothetical protein